MCDPCAFSEKSKEAKLFSSGHCLLEFNLHLAKQASERVKAHADVTIAATQTTKIIQIAAERYHGARIT